MAVDIRNRNITATLQPSRLFSPCKWLWITFIIVLLDLCDPVLTQGVTSTVPMTLVDSPSSSLPLLIPSTSGELPPLVTNGTVKPASRGMCRDRMGVFTPRRFNLWACGFCLLYLYGEKDPRPQVSFNTQSIVIFNASGTPIETVLPDIDNGTHVQKVCSALSKTGYECQRWKSCCQAAKRCCQQQLAAQATPSPDQVGGRTSNGYTAEGVGYCPATWDGFSCWQATPAGSTVSHYCPGYIEHASTDEMAVKQCHENGSWFVSLESHQEWTDYTGCIDAMDHHWVLFWVGVACNSISIVLLVPACFILLYFRSLRSQHRIKLHVCLFISYVLTNVLMLMWETIFVQNRLTRGDSMLQANSVGCRVLHALTRYSWTTNFMWMFLEGLHLYRLMVHAFAVPRSLLPFYISGFSIPVIPTLIYIIIRSVKDDLNTKCWVPPAGNFEWIIYTPIIIFLAGNIFFLCKILHVMLTQLQSHPNEPSSYRRAAKAAGILVPLFGLQAVLVIASPDSTSDFFEVFEIFSKIVTNTQGALVAIGFCYMNSEVLTMMRNNLPRSLRSRSLLRSDQRSSMSTQFTTDAPSRSHVSRTSASVSGSGYGGGGGGVQTGGAGYIPLSTVGDDGGRTGNAGNGKAEKLHNGFV